MSRMTETTQVCLVAYEAISADVAPGKRVFLFIRRAGRRDWAANLSSGSFESISIGVFFDRYMVRKQKFGICVCSSLMTCAAGLCRAVCEVQRCHAQCRFDKRTVRQSLSGFPVARPIVIGVAGSEGLTRETSLQYCSGKYQVIVDAMCDILRRRGEALPSLYGFMTEKVRTCDAALIAQDEQPSSW